MEVFDVDNLSGGNSNIFFMFAPKLGKIPSLTSIFFKGIETTNQQLIGEAEEQHCVPFVGC